MKNTAKKVLAVLLCVALCAMMPISIAASAEDSTEQAAARAALIEAWNGLSGKTDVLAVPQASYTLTGDKTTARQAVTKDTVVAGLADPSVLGPYWVEKAQCVQGWKEIYLDLITSPTDLTQYDSITLRAVMYKKDGATVAPVKFYTQLNHGNTGYTESRSWSNLAVQKISGVTSFKFLPAESIDSNTDYGYVSFGSLLGTKNVKAFAPSDADTISFEALVAEAKQFDAAAYDNGVEAFNTALLEAVKLTETEGEEAQKLALLDAWQNLTFKRTDVIAVPNAAGYKLDGEEPTLPTEVTADTKVAGLADPSVLGPYFIDKAVFHTTGWTYQVGLTMQITPVDLNKYDALNLYAVAYKADGVTVAPLKFNVQVNGGSSRYYEVRQFGNIQPAKVAGATGIKFIGESALDGNTDYGFLSFGSVWGTRTEAAVIPANAVQMSLDEVYAAAKKVDLTTCNGGKDAFVAKLNEIYAAKNPEAAALAADLIEAWEGLSYQVTDIIARPKAEQGAKAVDETTAAAAGLTDASVLGDTWAEKMEYDASKYGTINLKLEKTDATAYGSALNFWVAGYDADGNAAPIKIECMYAYSGGKKYITINGWSNVGFPNFGTGANYNVGFRNAYGESACTVKSISFGCITGTRNEYAVLPAGVEGLTLPDLFEVAKALDLTAFDGGVEEFTDALDAAYAYLYPEAGELKAAWEGLGKVEIQREIVARPQAAHGAKAVDEATAAAAGLTDASVLGDTWAEKMEYDASKYGTINLQLVKNDATPYTSLDFWVAGYDADGNAAPIKIECMYAWSGGKKYVTINGWSNVLFPNFGTGANNNVAFRNSYGESACTVKSISFGCIVGNKPVTVYAEVPAELKYATLGELIEAAAQVDTSLYAEGVEEFETLIDELYAKANPKAPALKEAWENLVVGIDWSAEMAAPPANPTAIAELPELGLTDDQLALMGPKFTTTISQGEGYGAKMKFANMAEYDYIEISYYQTAGTTSKIWFLYAPSGEGFSALTWEFNTQPGFHTVQWDEGHAAAAPLLTGAKTFNGIKLGITTGGNAYLGTAMAGKKVYATVPAELAYASTATLVEAAKALDLSGVIGSTDAFLAAIADAENEQPTEEEEDVPTEGIIEVENEGTVEYSTTTPAAGDAVTVSVTAPAGKQIKAGSLKVYNAKGEAIGIPQRVGFREEGTADSFAFTMPNGAAYVDCEYVSDKNPNLGLVGRSINEEKAGLRNVYRLNITQEGGKYFTTVNGVKEEVTGFGILVCTEKTYKKLSSLNLDATANEFVKQVEFLGHGYRYDVCSEYEDISVAVTGLDAHATMPIYTRAYISTAAGTFYTNASASAYAG